MSIAKALDADQRADALHHLAEGELDVVTEAVEHITGHPPKTLREFLDAYPESYAHLTG